MDSIVRPLKEIPVVHLHRLLEDRRKSEEVKLFGAALEDIGFCYIEGHGLSLDLLTDCYFRAKEFFELPAEVKAWYDGGHLHYQRGWTPPNVEQAVGAKQKDAKENLFFGPPRVPKDLAREFPDHYHANIWPDEIPDLKPLMEDLYGEFLVIGKVLSAALERYIIVPQINYFLNLTQDGPHLLRPLYYPPIMKKDIGKVLWGGRHTDLNFLTILPPSTSSGLMIKKRSGEWIKGAAPKGCVIAQVGDQLQYVTGGRLLSAVHRVDAPLAECNARLSIAFFIHARSNQLLSLLPSCRQWCRHPENYRPIRAIDFVNMRIEEIKLKKSNGGR